MKYVKLAKALVEPLERLSSAEEPRAAACLTAELAEFCCASEYLVSNAHPKDMRVTEAYLAYAVDKRLSDAAVFRVGMDVPTVREELGLHKFSIDKVSTAKPSSRRGSPAPGSDMEQLQIALEEIRGSLRASIGRFFSSLTERPVQGALVRTGAKAVDLVYRALVCAFAESDGFDIIDDVLLPLFQALLKAHNEYGWSSNSCAPGSISFVVAVLEGRLDLDETANPLAIAMKKKTQKNAKARDSFAELTKYRKGLEDALFEPTPKNLEAIRAEAMQRCAGKVAAGSRPPRATLEEIFEIIIVEPDAFAYATNELRGFFFSQLTAEFDNLLKDRFYGDMDPQRRARSHRPSDGADYREPEHISDAMGSLLDDLFGVADVFARSFLIVVEDIPHVFGMALKP
jgi:hypothetical protein